VFTQKFICSPQTPSFHPRSTSNAVAACAQSSLRCRPAPGAASPTGAAARAAARFRSGVRTLGCPVTLAVSEAGFMVQLLAASGRREDAFPAAEHAEAEHACRPSMGPEGVGQIFAKVPS